MSKKIIYFAAFVGSVIGGYLPALWGVGLFSFTSILFSGLGGILAIVLIIRLSQ